MADTLDRMESRNPLDATLESVIPGMNDRFMSIEGNINNKMGGLSDQVTSLSNQISDFYGMVKSHQQDQEKKNDELAKAYIRMAAILQKKKKVKSSGDDDNGSDSEDFLPGNLNLNVSSTSNQTTIQDKTKGNKKVRNENYGDAATFVPKTRYHSVRDIMDEWFGMGECENEPVRGGINACEERWNSKWRRHFSPAQKKHFGRIRRIVEEVQIIIDTENKTREEAMKEMEDDFERKEVKKSISNMVEYIKRKKILKNQQNEESE